VDFLDNVEDVEDVKDVKDVVWGTTEMDDDDNETTLVFFSFFFMIFFEEEVELDDVGNDTRGPNMVSNSRRTFFHCSC